MKFFLIAASLVFVISAQAKTLKIMNYNAENFFDLKHDEGTEDYTYLPLSVKRVLKGHKEYCNKIDSNFYRKECLNLDWTEAKYTKKILSIAKVIKSYDESGKGPDIVVFQEVENVNVLSQLVSKGLDKLGYQYQVVLEGDDTRGIDVGLISKFPVVKARHHSLVIDGRKVDTRGILEVELDVNGESVVIFGNHWPSQSNPTSERIASAQLLSQLALKTKADLVVAMGDFNSLDSETPHPFQSLDHFMDVEKEARAQGVPMHPGTHYYRGEWSSLDHIFIHSQSALKPTLSSYQIMNRPFMMKRDSRTGDMIPHRFDFQTGEGFSDHLPIGLEFNY